MVYALLVLIALAVWLYCLFEVMATDEAEVRSLTKRGWFLIVLLGFQVGALLWTMLGRPRPAERAATGGAPPLPPRPPAEAPKGPDDDPDFLRNLDRRIRGEE